MEQALPSHETGDSSQQVVVDRIDFDAITDESEIASLIKEHNSDLRFPVKVMFTN
jgi:hypothetical protein